MTIKKKNSAAESASAAPVAGGATIADRFKLDMPDPSAKKSAGSTKGDAVAALAGLIALAAVGILTFTIYQHWQYLMPV